MTDHERIEELLAVRALGGLDGDDDAELERALAEHGPACATCARLSAELEEAAGSLAFALEPAAVPEWMEDHVVARALGTGTPLVAVGGTAAAPAAPRRADRPGRTWRALVGVAAAFGLLSAGWLLREVTVPEPEETTPALAGTQVVTFEGAEGTLAVAYRPGEAGVYIVGSDLPAPPQGKVYEVWMIQDSAPVAGPCLVPEADGSLFTYVDAELGTTDTMAVTVEPSSCPDAPTSDPILTADLSAA
jgi:hypothetical protein